MQVLAISEIKVMVVLPTIQAVYDFGQLLRARAKTQKTALVSWTLSIAWLDIDHGAVLMQELNWANNHPPTSVAQTLEEGLLKSAALRQCWLRVQHVVHIALPMVTCWGLKEACPMRVGLRVEPIDPFPPISWQQYHDNMQTP